MKQGILHIGLTVSNLQRSIAFYRDVLGLEFVGEMEMSGPETEILFQKKACEAKVAYLKINSSEGSPLLELIEFQNVSLPLQPCSLFRTSISEVCFLSEDIDTDFAKLSQKGVIFLSSPQTFDSSRYGFGKSRAVYFKDPDGIILELLQPLS